MKLEDALDCADMPEEEVSSASATASGGGDGMAAEGGADSHAGEDERVDASDSEAEVDSGMGNQGPALLRGDVHDGGHDGCVVCQRATEESEGDKAVSYEVDAMGRFFQRCRWTPVPPFSSERVSPQGDGEGDRSALDERDLAGLALKYPWPACVELCLPTVEGRSRQAYNRCMVVFTAALEYGFRFPIPPLYQDFINCHRVSPSQISPNSWRFMAGYVAACRVGNIATSARHMSGVLLAKEASGLLTLSFTGSGLMKKRDASWGWRPNWFLVRVVGDFNFGCTGTSFPPHF